MIWRRAGIGTMLMIWVCTLGAALADGGDAVGSALVNLTLFTAIVGACVLGVRRLKRRR